MQNPQYQLFPEQKSQYRTQSRIEPLFPSKQHQRQGSLLNGSIQQLQQTHPTFLNNTTKVNGTVLSQPIQYAVPQQIIQQLIVPQQFVKNENISSQVLPQQIIPIQQQIKPNIQNQQIQNEFYNLQSEQISQQQYKAQYQQDQQQKQKQIQDQQRVFNQIQYQPPSALSESQNIFVPVQSSLNSSQVRTAQPQTPLITKLIPQQTLPNSTVISRKNSQLLLSQTQSQPLQIASTFSTPQALVISNSPLFLNPSSKNIVQPNKIQDSSSFGRQTPESNIQNNQSQNSLNKSNGFIFPLNNYQVGNEQQNINLISVKKENDLKTNSASNKSRVNNKSYDFNNSKQQVCQILQQSKNLIQNNIHPQNEKLKEEYYGLKQFEKLSLENSIQIDEKFKQFEKRRLQFNQKIQEFNRKNNQDDFIPQFQNKPSQSFINDLYSIQQQKLQNNSSYSGHRIETFSGLQASDQQVIQSNDYQIPEIDHKQHSDLRYDSFSQSKSQLSERQNSSSQLSQHQAVQLEYQQSQYQLMQNSYPHDNKENIIKQGQQCLQSKKQQNSQQIKPDQIQNNVILNKKDEQSNQTLDNKTTTDSSIENNQSNQSSLQQNDIEYKQQQSRRGQEQEQLQMGLQHKVNNKITYVQEELNNFDRDKEQVNFQATMNNKQSGLILLQQQYLQQCDQKNQQITPSQQNEYIYECDQQKNNHDEEYDRQCYPQYDTQQEQQFESEEDYLRYLEMQRYQYQQGIENMTGCVYQSNAIDNQNYKNENIMNYQNDCEQQSNLKQLQNYKISKQLKISTEEINNLFDHQQSCELYSSQNKQSYEELNEEDKLVRLRQLQLITEKNKREEEQQKQFQQQEQEELLKISSNSSSEQKQYNKF